MESTFYRKIVGVERFFAEYFRVGYYGKGFDQSLQGREFIYRGMHSFTIYFTRERVLLISITLVRVSLPVE